jgi:hypothetical protein
MALTAIVFILSLLGKNFILVYSALTYRSTWSPRLGLPGDQNFVTGWNIAWNEAVRAGGKELVEARLNDRTKPGFTTAITRQVPFFRDDTPGPKPWAMS